MKFSSLFLLCVTLAAVSTFVAAADDKSKEGVKDTTTEEKAKKQESPATKEGAKTETAAKEERAKKETPAATGDGAKKDTSGTGAAATGDDAKKETSGTGAAATGDDAKKETSGTGAGEGAKQGTAATPPKEAGGEAATAGDKGTGDAGAKGDGSEAKGEVGEVDKPKGEEEPQEEVEAPSGIRDPRPCEVCKYLAVELQGRLAETDKRKEYIETGHGIMPGDRKRKDYKKSELRLIEAVNEPHVCDRILAYDIHAERKKSLRYAKGHSETRRTLHGLVNKGVKVDLGIPYEIWKHNAPPNEITHLQRLCIELVEEHEDDLEEWYWGYQELSLLNYLCRDRYLKNKDAECLTEEFKQPEPTEEDKEEKKPDKVEKQEHPKEKGDTGTKTDEKPFVPPSMSSNDPKAPEPKPAGQPASKEEL